MATTLESGNDVVSYLEVQHKEVKSLMSRVLATRGEERAEAFEDLRRTLEIHEAAEEAIVHPASQKALSNGEAIVAARMTEEGGAKQALAELERLEIDSAAFEAKFRLLEREILAHAEREEKEEFEPLRSALEVEQLNEMRRDVEAAEAMSPSHPGAGLELIERAHRGRRSTAPSDR